MFMQITTLDLEFNYAGGDGDLEYRIRRARRTLINLERVSSVVFEPDATGGSYSQIIVGPKTYDVMTDTAELVMQALVETPLPAAPAPAAGDDNHTPRETISDRVRREIQDASVPPPNITAPVVGEASLTGFKEMLRWGDYLVLDTETTGLEDGEIVQIAIMDSRDKVLLDTLIKPKLPIPASATAIHGITDAMVEDSPSWELIQPEVYRLLKGQHVVIYNAVYDRKMMHRSSERWGLPKTEWKEIAAFWCAMEMFAEIFGAWNDYRGNYRWQKLSTAAAHYGIEQPEAHTALADVMTTLALCRAIAKQE